jgi:predicted nucleic acid-binding protein
MIGRVLVDTGPLVALRMEDEASHAQCLEALKRLPTPLLTCWPVLTEAAYLLRAYPEQLLELLDSANGGLLEILALTAGDVPPINGISRQYADQGFQLADAALMHLANREAVEHIFTLDIRDFTVFRPPAGKKLSIVSL